MLTFYIFAYEGEEVDPAPVVKTFTQDEVNRINKAEKEAKLAAIKKAEDTEKLLNDLQNQHKMTETEKEELANKLKEYEESKLTEEQKKQIEVERLKKTFDAEKTEISTKLENTVKDYHNLLITREITSAAIEGKVVAFDGTGEQVLRLLRQDAEVNAEGQVIIGYRRPVSERGRC